MIGNNKTPQIANDWLAGFKAALSRNPRGAWILTILVLVLSVMWGRLILGRGGPRDASAATHSTISSDGTYAEPMTLGRRSNSGPSLVEWANQPVTVLSRNLFKTPLNEYPLDPSHATAPTPAETEAKLAAARAEEERRVLSDGTSNMVLEGTVLGSHPGAWISGAFVRVGDVIGTTRIRVVGVDNRSAYLSYGKARAELSMK